MWSRIIWAVVVCALGAAGLWVWRVGPHDPRALGWLLIGTPHQRYAAALEFSGRARTPDGQAWLESAERALRNPRQVSLSGERWPLASGRQAAAFSGALRRGQYLVVEAPAAADSVFLDLFQRDGDDLRHVESAAPGDPILTHVVRADGEYVVRVQPALETSPRGVVQLRVEPSLLLPVAEATQASIDSFFGDPRDNGARRHEGVDIFARRGTPVLAAADGIVTSVRTTAIGGNIVWVMRPWQGERHYYAHLDEQLVTPGTRVKAGDVLGTVGNTGNARTTPPHLHFGIYATGGAVDPLPYIAPPRYRPRGV